MISSVRFAKIPDEEAILSLCEDFRKESLQFGTFSDELKDRTEAELKRRLQDKNHGQPIYVSCIDKKVIGYLTGQVKVRFDDQTKTAELENIFIRNDYRGNSLGTKIMKRFWKWCKSKEVGLILTYPFEKDEQASSFYHKLGFTTEEICERPQHSKLSLRI